VNFSRFVQRRARGDRFLALGVLVAVFLAATVASGGPIYLRSLEKVGMADVVKTIGRYNKNVGAISDWIPLEANEIANANSIVDSAVNSNLEPIITHGSTRIKSRAHFWQVEDDDPETETQVRRGDLASRAYFTEMEGLFDAVNYVEGRAPGQTIRQDEDGNQTIEVAIYLGRSTDLRHGDEFIDLHVGDIIHASSVSRRSGTVKGEIVGIFDAKDRADEFWLGSPSAILDPEPPILFGGQDLPIILFTDEDTIAAGVGPSNAGLPMSYTRILFTDPDKIAEAKASVLVGAMNAFDEAISADIPRGTAFLGARTATRRMDQKMVFLRLPALLLAALAISVVGYYLFLVAGLIARKRELETVMLRSRGLSTFQVMRVQIIEAGITVLLPAAISPLLAFLAIGFAGRLPVFESLTGGSNLPVELSPMAWVWAAAAAVLAFLIVLAPTLLVARSGVSNVDRTRARPDKPPIFQRLYFDLLIIILGSLFLWEMTSRGVASTDRDGEIVTDPALLFAPAMLLISVALVMLRAFPIITKASAWIAVQFTSASMAVGFWRLGRSPYWYAWPVLLLILGTGLGVMVGTLGSTLERSDREQIFYDNGTNLRVLPGGINIDVRQQEIDQLMAIDGVNSATMAFRQKAKTGTTDQGLQFNVLGVETDKFPDMAWFREDFSDESLDELFQKVAIPSKPEPLVLPVGTTHLSAWTMQDPFVRDHFFWIVLKDSEGRQVTVTLGQIGESWSEQSNTLPQHLVPPIEITSLQTFMQAGGDGGAPTTWFIDDLKAVGPGFEETILDFDGQSLWTALPTSNGLDDNYIDVPEPPGVGDPGTGVGQMTLERGTVAGVRGAYRSATGDPVPVIVSENFVALTGIQPGEPTVVQISGGFIPVILIGVAELFPTLDPSRVPFMVLDVKTLLAFVELRGLVNISANEVFLDIDPGNHVQITADVRQIFRGGSLLDREARVEDSVIDPLTVAGWRGMGIVSLIIGGIALVLGYVTYLVAHSNRTVHDSAYLRAMGFSKPGFMRSAIIEHGIVAVLGIAVGVSAGLVASRLAVGAIAYSETGRALLPPFILQTSWWPVLAILIIAGVAGFVGIVASFIGFLRRPLHELTRSAE
jgi:hypothetical protein